MRYSGRVQGVGFRATCVRIAAGYQVTGRVCNLTDGNVELVVEGEKGEVKRFCDQIATELSRNIRDHHASWQPAQGSWTDFTAAPDKQP